MWKSRLCYLLVLLCTSVFFICYNGYISLYVFVLSLLFPVFAFLLSLPGVLGLRVELLAGREGPGASLTGTSCARKGEAIPLQLAGVERHALFQRPGAGPADGGEHLHRPAGGGALLLYRGAQAPGVPAPALLPDLRQGGVPGG